MKKHFSILTLLLLSLPAIGQIAFTDIADKAGVGEISSNHGVSIIDYDGDGWEDIYVACRQGPNQLYRNLGDGTYKDVAAEVGLAYEGDSRVAVWGDVNNDGRPELFIGTEHEGDKLYFQNEDHVFLDMSGGVGMKKDVSAISAIFGDVDNDGYLDLYVARHYAQNTLYRNLGIMYFDDITMASGATDTVAAMGALFVDYDNDRDLDIYLVHDTYFPNILYQNDGGGHFTDVSEISGTDYAGFGMGVDIGDINNDGWQDIYITNFFENTLLLNEGDGTFSDISKSAKVRDIGMGWGTTFVDVDNDGFQDIYLCNSKVANDLFPHYPNVLYRNLGNETFEKINDTVLASMGNAYGLATGDFNKDGRPDLVIANSQDDFGNELLENQTVSDNHWIAVRLEGTLSNRLAIGARVKVKADGVWRIKEVLAGASWASQNSLVQHVGLGSATWIDSLTIIWPSGTVDHYEQMEVDQFLEIKESSIPDSNGKGMQLSPNPVTSFGTITISQVADNQGFKLIDLQGKSIFIKNSTYDPTIGKLKLTLSGLQAGIYFLHMRDKSWKVVVSR